MVVDIYGVVPVIQSGKCQVSIPCRGDRYAAMAGDDEMIFTVPRGRLEDLIMGLRHVHETGSKLPRTYKMESEYELPESYAKIGEMLGIDVTP